MREEDKHGGSGILAVGLILMGLSVAMGAVGAHLVAHYHPEAIGSFETAVRYHSLHAMGLIILALSRGFWSRKAYGIVAAFFAAGLVLFCGGLYAKTLLQFSFPNGFIPSGGMAFILGWLIWGAEAIRLKWGRRERAL
ncbi:DUF423 domain-containing protein [Hahella sp. KA22]|uniref:DUF423 domain-containing protein n=1 Tax=Hahella sp. KA22 TaxID=1628392 RepID=UPI000FDD09AC|nr:DUF423 domain-containing protein [Hahella sp. KA22]AZZ94509.1 DUF423 domain-containing protein [Hahella sp. KA22]QAY57882.1 DUF423 domain-containing protein [Hahella sp. KA22]